ncbi:MAG: hypothetical protein D6775_04285 [Caldilineae bacterium]|nr:MAG: hypothetical protein D6775_04285 [Caldilineae bacterium]
MTARGMLRGGLSGALLTSAFSILGIIPICGFVALPLRLLAWTFGGYVGGRIATQGVRKGNGVVAGLGAGIITGLADGMVNVLLAPVRFKLAGDTITSLHLLPAGVINLFRDMGIDLFALDTIGGSVFFAVLLCGVVWILAAMLGALGGGIAHALSE